MAATTRRGDSLVLPEEQGAANVFIEQGTELVEIEGGNAVNESPTIALQKAIEGAILEIVKIGYERRYWSYE